MAKSANINYKEVHNIARVKQFINESMIWSASLNMYSIIKCHVVYESEKLGLLKEDVDVRFEEAAKIGRIDLSKGASFYGETEYKAMFYPKGLKYELVDNNLIITGRTAKLGKFKCTITAKEQN